MVSSEERYIVWQLHGYHFFVDIVIRVVSNMVEVEVANLQYCYFCSKMMVVAVVAVVAAVTLSCCY